MNGDRRIENGEMRMKKDIGHCPVCGVNRVRVFGAVYARIGGRVKSARPLNAELIIISDSASNPMITLLPVKQARHG